MTHSITAPVKPELLIWARESAGFRPEEAAHKLTISIEKLSAVEKGEAHLTFAQLKKASEVYKRPLAAFFLESAPPLVKNIPDFRLHPDVSQKPLSPRLNFEIRKAQQHREDALELAKAIDQPINGFNFKATLDENPDEVASKVRQYLGFSLEKQIALPNNAAALKAWKQAIESLSVLVFETSRIPTEEMRGLAIPSEELPVIVLNGGDSHAGRTFTLLHEFTHLLLRQSGVCDLAQIDSNTHEARIEMFCNAVAGATLVPAQAILSILPDNQSHLWTSAELDDFSRHFLVSKEVVLRRLLQLGRTTVNHYKQMREQFIKEYRELRIKQKEKDKEKEIRIQPAVMTVRNLGKPFVRLVINAYIEERIALSTVSDYLGIKLKHIPRVQDLLRNGELVA